MSLTRFRESWLWPFALIAALPVFWAVWALLQGFALSGDNAWMALRTFDIFSTNPPLTGMPSTSSADAPGVYANHPGPFQFVMIAPFYALTGWAPWAMAIGSLGLNLSLVAIALWAAWRIDLPSAKFAAVSGSFMVVLSLQTGLMHPWNPRPVQMGMIALAILIWAILIGRTWCWPWLAFVSAIVAQGHVVGLPIVWFAVIVMLALFRRFGFPRKPSRAEIRWTTAIFALAWVLPFWDVLVNWPGNLGALLAYMASASGKSEPVPFLVMSDWKLRIIWFSAIAVVSLVRGRKVFRSPESTREDKEWAAGLYIFGLLHIGMTILTFAGGADRMSYNHILSGLFWAGLFLQISRAPQWWMQFSHWTLIAVIVIAYNVNLKSDGFAESVAEFRDHQTVADAAATLVAKQENLPIVVKHFGAYSWINLYSATVLKLATDGKDVHYDPIGQPNAYDTQRRIARVDEPYLELWISDTEGGLPDDMRFEADEVVASKKFNLGSSKNPVALTLLQRNRDPGANVSASD